MTPVSITEVIFVVLYAISLVIGLEITYEFYGAFPIRILTGVAGGALPVSIGGGLAGFYGFYFLLKLALWKDQ